VRVAPFKAQNMALNSAVTSDGGEIGRAQHLQAVAAGVEPEVAMNPVLLKPTGERASQVIVRGQPWAVLGAVEYYERKLELLEVVLDALADLRRRFDVVVCEGAGSPTELNLLDHDIVNLRIAHEAGFPAVVVGDIDRGGVFAALYGTVMLLPDEYRRLVRGFVVNKLRGDPTLLLDVAERLEAACGVPTLGVLPMLPWLDLDAEDSLWLDRRGPDRDGGGAGAVLDVAVVRFPHISNFTDLDPLRAEPGVAVRFVQGGRELGRPDLVVLPGTKATVADLGWLRRQGLAAAIEASGATVLGICGGQQMLGLTIDDPIESGDGVVDGLGWLPVRTTFEAAKVLRRRDGTAFGCSVQGYQIHHGRVQLCQPTEAWLTLDGEADGVRRGRVLGTSLHGLFEADDFRHAFLADVAGHAGVEWRPSDVRFGARREAQLDRLADALEEHLDVAQLLALVDTVAVSP
jgi:adenosylcobyric acid synthase